MSFFNSSIFYYFLLSHENRSLLTTTIPMELLLLEMPHCAKSVPLSIGNPAGAKRTHSGEKWENQ
jgi:hypothetical protein